MHPSNRSGLRGTGRASLLAIVLSAAFGLGLGPCVPAGAPRFSTGKPLFTSPQANPVALSADGQILYVANTTAGTVSMVDVSSAASPQQIAEIAVGIDPVAIAVRPPVAGNGAVAPADELVFVTNHISDSISVISRSARGVVQTVQELEHADGGSTPDDLVTTTDEPVGIAFANPCLAFVTLDQPNQVIALELPDANGNQLCDEEGGAWRVGSTRIQVTAQAPRALAVAGGKLFVAAFESGNQTEFPTCGADDPRGRTPGAPDEGCEFQSRVIDAVTILSINPFRFNFDLGSIFDFAARNPNIGGRVIKDADIPDRDLFVYDLAAPGFDSDPSKPGVQAEQVVQHLGTLLYGVATDAAGGVYVTHTDARNHQNGLHQLGNRMFENRLAILDCAGGACAGPITVDLDASASGLGTTFPTPYGVGVSGNGSTLVVTAAGSDGTSGFPGLYTLDAAGNVLGSAVTGAIPQGVALRSGPGGAPDRAFVLNTVDGSLSVVDVRNPAAPAVEATIVVGSDPTPAAVRKGRIAFSSARSSTSGTFSCESCHPNGNIDQLLWTINAFEAPPPDDVPGIEPAEPRTTQPIRGLRDTLPLHWEGRLADPLPGITNDPARPNLVPGDTAPDCDVAADGEVACIRHLVNASLSGVMCAQPNCPVGPSGLPGALTDQERNEMATFLQAVSYPPSPRRRPSDRLSDTANLGVQDFFTDEDGLGIASGIGNAVGFGVVTCADNAIGCHSLPLTVGTNSKIVGNFDAPSARGMWDRFLLFSNGGMSSEEFMRMTQECANGIEPAPNPNLLGLVTGDPCNLKAPNLPFLRLADLPFPSGAHIYDAEEGYTERGAFLATFEGIFALAYGVRGDRIWEYQVEIGVGFPGLAGRQVSVTPANAHDASTVAQMDQLETAAADGKVVAIARTPGFQELRYDAATDTWANPHAVQLGGTNQLRLAGATLRDLAVSENVVWTITAELPDGITAGGADRQPLLDIDPDVKAVEMEDADGDGIPDPGGVAPGIPRPAADLPASFRVGIQHLEPGATLLVDGAVCRACSLTITTAANGQAAADVEIPQGLAHGTHVIQAQNPGGWISNELPVFAQ
jgi:DNA-binding beta-propeller fold protein YncE